MCHSIRNKNTHFHYKKKNSISTHRKCLRDKDYNIRLSTGNI